MCWWLSSKRNPVASPIRWYYETASVPLVTIQWGRGFHLLEIMSKHGFLSVVHSGY
jgi:hypothetical protein